MLASAASRTASFPTAWTPSASASRRIASPRRAASRAADWRRRRSRRRTRCRRVAPPGAKPAMRRSTWRRPRRTAARRQSQCSSRRLQAPPQSGARIVMIVGSKRVEEKMAIEQSEARSRLVGCDTAAKLVVVVVANWRLLWAIDTLERIAIGANDTRSRVTSPPPREFSPLIVVVHESCASNDHVEWARQSAFFERSPAAINQALVCARRSPSISAAAAASK